MDKRQYVASALEGATMRSIQHRVLTAIATVSLFFLAIVPVDAQQSYCTTAWGYQVCAEPWIAEAIYSAGGAYGDWMFQVAACESGFNPAAVGPNGEIGLFQFEETTFYAHGGVDIWSVYDQSRVAASMFAQGLSWHWVTAGGC
jgi:soluble lytic murein transglycosylase-like protein